MGQTLTFLTLEKEVTASKIENKPIMQVLVLLLYPFLKLGIRRTKYVYIYGENRWS
jgi:hypothetical protein